MALPFPIAHLVRRAHNAKGPKERHDTAFFAWEASVRLAVAAAPPNDLSFLGDPSTGAWVKSMRMPSDPSDALPLRKVTLLFSTAQMEGGNPPKTVNAKKTLEHLASYRNEVHGHGSTRTGEFYDPAADVLLEALELAWSEGMFWPKGAELVYVESIELRGANERRARIVDLTGTAPLLGGPREGTRVADDIQPRRLYMHTPRKDVALSTSGSIDRSAERSGKLSSVHPWLLYQESELRERVLFFNGRRKTARYLDYVGGEIVKGQKLNEGFPEIEQDLDQTFGAQGTSSLSAVPAAPVSEGDPNRIGDYELLGKLGEGGMGVVHLARQESLGRTVALKVLHPGAAEDPVTVARFKREIAALARLDHKNIVSILDSGEDKGKLYYAMELVEGADLAQIAGQLSGRDDFYAAVSTASEIARGKRTDGTLPSAGVTQTERPSRPTLVDSRGDALRLPARIRVIAELFRDAARAVHYLHTQGMIHRDLKPANLMVTSADHRVVLMDLGLVVMGNASRSITKDKSSILGTLRYMPPEQLQRNAAQVDRRVDVYALGATFYELLTERPFFDGDTETRLVAQVLNEEPIPPSKGKIKLPADLCTILEKATKKDPSLRYDSADDLANDLDAYLTARPIRARAPTLAYVARMAALRNKPLTALVALSALLLFVGVPSYAVREQRRRIHADALTREAEQQRNEARLAVARILEEQGRQELISGRPQRALATLVASKAGGNDGPTLRFMIGRAARNTAALELSVAAHEEAITMSSFSSNGELFVTGSSDRTARIWDAKTGAMKHRLELGERIASTFFDGDGKRIVVSTKREVALFDVASGKKLFGLDEPRELLSPSLWGDGNAVLVPMWNNTAQIIDLASKKVIVTLSPPKRFSGNDDRLPLLALVAPDGEHVLTTSPTSGLVLWDIPAGKPPVPHVLAHDDCEGDTKGRSQVELRGDPNGSFDSGATRVITTNGCTHEGRIWDVATRKVLASFQHSAFATGATFMPDGKRVLGLGDDGRIGIFRADNGRLVTYLHDRGASLVEPRVTADGTRILTRSDDERVRVFEARTGSLLCVLDGHRAPVVDLDIASSGKRILTAGEDGAVKLSSEVCGWERVAIDRTGDGAALSADGKQLVLWDPLGAELVDLATKERRSLGTRPEPPGSPTDGVTFAAFSRDGSVVATAGADGATHVWRASDRGMARTFTHTAKVRVVRFSADGKRLLTASDDKSARVWDVTTGEPRALLAHAAAVGWAAFFADDRRVVTRTDDDVVTIWDAESGAALKTLPYKAGKFAELDVAGKAPRFSVPCDDGTVRVWDDAGALVGTLRGTAKKDRRARLSPDGKRALTSAGEKTTRMWEVAAGSVSFVMDGDRGRLRDAVFSPDGSFVLASGDDGAARIFDARSGKLLDIADGHREAIDAIDVSANGGTFFTRASAGFAEEVVVWTMPEDTRDLAALKALVAKTPFAATP